MEVVNKFRDRVVQIILYGKILEELYKTANHIAFKFTKF